MTNNEIQEIISKGKDDGAKLYRVADILYKVALAVVIGMAMLGVVLFFVAANSASEGVAFSVLFATALLCAIGYAAAVLSSHGFKVLVHILFSNLALLEKEKN